MLNYQQMAEQRTIFSKNRSMDHPVIQPTTPAESVNVCPAGDACKDSTSSRVSETKIKKPRKRRSTPTTQPDQRVQTLINECNAADEEGEPSQWQWRTKESPSYTQTDNVKPQIAAQTNR